MLKICYLGKCVLGEVGVFKFVNFVYFSDCVC